MNGKREKNEFLMIFKRGIPYVWRLQTPTISYQRKLYSLQDNHINSHFSVHIPSTFNGDSSNVVGECGASAPMEFSTTISTT